VDSCETNRRADLAVSQASYPQIRLVQRGEKEMFFLESRSPSLKFSSESVRAEFFRYRQERLGEAQTSSFPAAC